MTGRIRKAEVRLPAAGQTNTGSYNAEYANNRLREVSAYLPANYTARLDVDRVLIEGIDQAGWTLTEYVIPRLATGLIRAQEVAP